MDPTPPRSGRRRRRREYLLALEEERRKIQVFQRELPLCLELVTQSTSRRVPPCLGLAGRRLSSSSPSSRSMRRLVGRSVGLSIAQMCFVSCSY